MLIQDYFRHPHLELPTPRPADTDLRDFLHAKYQAHAAVLASAATGTSDTVMDEVLTHTGLIQSIADRVLASIDAHLHGRLTESYGIFADALNDARPYLALTNNPDVPKVELLFRAREFKAPFEVETEALHHIPFQLRHRIGSQRYSIPGVPMLYLGSSSFGCWTELGRPPLEQFVASCWQVVGPVNVVNLSYTPANLSMFPAPAPGANPKLHAFLVAHAVIWPIVAATSVQTPRPERGFPFRVEYIAPQLLLRWAVEEFGCDAIRYFSTHLHPETDVHISANWVFPVKTDGRTGHCPQLLAKFKHSAPLSWTAAQVGGLQQSPPIATGHILLQPSVITLYANTEFATFDGCLQALARS